MRNEKSHGRSVNGVRKRESREGDREESSIICCTFVVCWPRAGWLRLSADEEGCFRIENRKKLIN